MPVEQFDLHLPAVVRGQRLDQRPGRLGLLAGIGVTEDIAPVRGHDHAVVPRALDVLGKGVSTELLGQLFRAALLAAEIDSQTPVIVHSRDSTHGPGYPVARQGEYARAS